jgi:predicted NAD/FAD-binding protein
VEHFDAVIMATHAPDTLKLLGAGATEQEKAILGAFPYEE